MAYLKLGWYFISLRDGKFNFDFYSIFCFNGAMSIGLGGNSEKVRAGGVKETGEMWQAVGLFKGHTVSMGGKGVIDVSDFSEKILPPFPRKSLSERSVFVRENGSS